MNTERILGISLAISSSLFIGASFIVKKKGLLNQKDFLKSPLWWTGLFLLVFGELLNLLAYSLAPVILVTPLGSLSVVITAILSSYFLNEKLSYYGKLGSFICLVGSVLVVLHSPMNNNFTSISQFLSLVLTPVFISVAVILVLISILVIFMLSSKYGSKTPLVYISICSMIGSLVVIGIQGIGSSIVNSITRTNEVLFTRYETWLIFILVVIGGSIQILYLNKALNQFNTAIVSSIYYVCFTFMTIFTSSFFENGVNGVGFATCLLGFLVNVVGVLLLTGDQGMVVDDKGLEGKGSDPLIRSIDTYIELKEGR